MALPVVTAGAGGSAFLKAAGGAGALNEAVGGICGTAEAGRRVLVVQPQPGCAVRGWVAEAP